MKYRPLAQFRFHPDSPTMLLDDAFRDCQTDARAGEFAAMQTLENAEDLLVIAWIDPDAVIPD